MRVAPLSAKLTTLGLFVATVYAPAVPSIIDSGNDTAVCRGTVNCRACITASGDAPPLDNGPTRIGLAPSDRNACLALSDEPAALLSLIW